MAECCSGGALLLAESIFLADPISYYTHRNRRNMLAANLL
ncbi:hypothetical protein ymoll0001_30790 [Yersinia mollaretii ATCC 43969]|uniref:Uncharacterized protein n=1 Tax=Yersinia mollaretii (strain ATCC 43969 / DSM 18520 / CIP 103324 / CNY 7263 / WAIP 204) TaxID=349967 RepID=A0ABP2EH39_YERMW|nr:hypothetical protein ymoll0001_30790 [Yersinia mollaretii ATCC 43969]